MGGNFQQLHCLWAGPAGSPGEGIGHCWLQSAGAQAAAQNAVLHHLWPHP